MKLSDLAEKTGLELSDLKVKIEELGFELKPRARTINDEVAELIIEELSGSGEKEDIVEIYDEIIAEEREREIVKSQRKMTAGTGKKKSKHRGSRTSSDRVKGVVEIPDSIPVKEFAEKTGLNVAKIIGELMKNGILANINQEIDFETANIIAEDLGVKIKRLRSAGSAEQMLSGDISGLLTEDDSSLLEERPAVVVVMGHVDHGKTKLLDSIRESDVVSGESGGITQHIGAYMVKKKGKNITFLDTPGHEAFTAMRARGAKVTDIAILVVAADEGVKPQTIEAINHAKDAGVPIIVAVNKMDKPEANPDKVKGELTEHGLQPEDWGGSTITVPVSALKGEGIDTLLDMVLLTAEMEELKANADRHAVATVIEAHLDQSLGSVATVLVNTGTLKITNNIVVGGSYGRVKLMKDHNGKAMRAAGPSVPVFIAGLNSTPKSGDILQVVKDEKTAREKAGEFLLLSKEEMKMKGSAVNQLISQVQSDKILKIIVKADAKGSLEAIKSSIAKIKDDEVAVKVIHSGVGTVTESDIMMATASHAFVAAFHCDFDSPNVQKIADQQGVEVKKYKVIYDLLEDIKRFLTGLLEPEVVEVVTGRVQIKQIFLTKKKELILGAKVLSGKAVNKGKIRVIRGTNEEDEDNVVGKGQIVSLRKVDEVVKEVKSGNDCGIKYVGDMDINEGDIFEVYVEEEKHREVT